MSLYILREVISDPDRLSDGYQIYDGFVFRAIRHPANVFDAIVIHNPASARRFGDTWVESFRSLEEHIDWINRNKWEKDLVIAEDISFLIHCPTLKHIDIIPSVTAGDHFDFAPLYRLPQILSLWCATNYGKFDRQHSKMDYSQVRGLEDLSVSTEYDVNYHAIPTLRKLSVAQYPGDDLRELFCIRNWILWKCCQVKYAHLMESKSRRKCSACIFSTTDCCLISVSYPKSKGRSGHCESGSVPRSVIFPFCLSSKIWNICFRRGATKSRVSTSYPPCPS